MGFGGISAFQLIIVLLIVLLLFGGKRLKNIGTDLGSAIKGFRKTLDNESEGNEKDNGNNTHEADAETLLKKNQALDESTQQSSHNTTTEPTDLHKKS